MGILKNSKRKIVSLLEKNTFFYTFLVSEALLMSWLNYDNQTMSGILPYYENYASFIKSGFNLSLPFSTGRYTFPMWGFGFVLAFSQNKFIIILIQQLVSLSSLLFLDKTLLKYDLISQKGWVLFRGLLLLGFSWHILHTSLWPYSLAASFMIFNITFWLIYLKTGIFKNIALSAFFLGLTLNLRSDYLYFVIFFFLIFFIFTFFKSIKNINRGHLVAWLGIILICLLPWSIYTKYRTDHFLLSSTNAGHVLYICLGQLPNNVWGITSEDGDTTMRKIITDNLGIAGNSLNYDGDVLLKAEWKKRVLSSPFDFLKKCCFNTYLFITRPFSTGELYRKFLNTEGELDSLKNNLKKDVLSFNIAALGTKMLDKRYIAFFIPILINLIGIAIIGLFFISLIKFLFKNRFNLMSNLFIFSLCCLAFYQIALLVFAYHHPNYNTNIYPVYSLLIAYFLYPMNNKITSRN